VWVFQITTVALSDNTINRGFLLLVWWKIIEYKTIGFGYVNHYFATAVNWLVISFWSVRAYEILKKSAFQLF